MRSLLLGLHRIGLENRICEMEHKMCLSPKDAGIASGRSVQAIFERRTPDDNMKLMIQSQKLRASVVYCIAQCLHMLQYTPSYELYCADSS